MVSTSMREDYSVLISFGKNILIFVFDLFRFSIILGWFLNQLSWMEPDLIFLCIVWNMVWEFGFRFGPCVERTTSADSGSPKNLNRFRFGFSRILKPWFETSWIGRWYISIWIPNRLKNSLNQQRKLYICQQYNCFVDAYLYYNTAKVIVKKYLCEHRFFVYALP